jgi:hypothetical protein
MCFPDRWPSLLLRVVFTAVLSQAASGIAKTQPVGGTADMSRIRCRNSDNYPVIVYDAVQQTAQIANRYDVLHLSHSPAMPNNVFPTDQLPRVTSRSPVLWGSPETYRNFDRGDGSPRVTKRRAEDLLEQPEGFLCDGRPVEVYVVNRRLKTSFTVTLTNTYQPPAGTLDLRGNPAPAAALPPGSKTFSSNAASNSNVLTTDQVIAAFLNDETFDHIYARVTDDASDVLAQARQFESNTLVYKQTLEQILGVPADAQGEPLGRASLDGVDGAWHLLQNAVDTAKSAAVPLPPPPPPAKPVLPIAITEFAFNDWTNRADRLETEVTRLNARMAAYPIADTLTNLQASAATLRDNYNDVLSERDAVNRALELLRGLPTPIPPLAGEAADKWKDRQQAEVRQYLRSHYTSTTSIQEQTLARIVASYLGSSTEPMLRSLRNIPPCAAVAGAPAPGAGLDNRVEDRYCRALEQLQPAAAPEVVTAALDSAQRTLDAVRNGVIVLNQSEGAALRDINDVYDRYYAPMEVWNLNLSGATGNLFVYYSVNGAEQFNRYQIASDLAVPQSNCVGSIALNTNVSGGVVSCGTVAAPGAPAASYSGTPFPAPVVATAPATNAPAVTPYAHLSSRVEVHHFSDGTLVTGIAYDSIRPPTFSWNACPISTTNTAGNFPSTMMPTCISPSTPATTGVAAATPYYQLISTTQTTAAAVQGVDLFFGHQDQFPARKMGPSLGALIGVSAYPLNHYYLGLMVECRGFNLSAGAAFSPINYIPSSFGYGVGSYAATNPTIPTDSKWKTGFFIMLGFDTNLFESIFNLSAFRNSGAATVVGAPTPNTPPTTTTQ